MLLEAMGLHVPGTAFVNPGAAVRDKLTREAVRTVLGSADFTCPPIGRLVDERCIVNATVALLATGGEIMAACEDGFTELKFFPAVQAGGVAMLKAWAGPFFDVKFCPTGGITLQNAPDFLALPNVVCVGGSWLMPPGTAQQGDWGRVARLASETEHLRKKIECWPR